MAEIVPIQNVLISVYDKSNLEPLLRALGEHPTRIYSTEGTGAFLEKQFGIRAQRIEALTQFPEMMEGRVKTLHPRIFGGILARRDIPKDLEEAKAHDVPLFDLVVVNLYPFWEHRGEEVDSQTPFIDIGGPSLIRASAKNFDAVTVLSSPEDYDDFIQELSARKGATTRAFRHRLAARAFERTSGYDAMIASEWRDREKLPVSISLAPQRELRYGENPHQKAAWAGANDASSWRVLQGKELSYNNLLDAEAALRLVAEFEKPALAIIKHNNPCGAAAAETTVATLFGRALASDSKSAFGGIVATNRTIDVEAADAMSQIFLEVVAAPLFSPEAWDLLSRRKNLRLIEWKKPRFQPFEVRSALGGWLVQSADAPGMSPDIETVTTVPVPPKLWQDLEFAWLVCKHVRSNAIVVAREGVTLGIGAGQMSRVDAVSIALQKAGATSLSGAVLASDAFFPFRDNIDLLKGTGIAAIIQPGGSQRDAEVIQACNEHGIAMAFAHRRHFRH